MVFALPIGNYILNDCIKITNYSDQKNEDIDSCGYNAYISATNDDLTLQ